MKATEKFLKSIKGKKVRELNAMKEHIDEKIEQIETKEFEKENPNLKEHSVDYTEKGFFIDDVLIDEEIYKQEMHEYSLQEREDQIEQLFGWIADIGHDSERQNDKQLMKDDLEYLQGLEDEWVFSSNRTNDFVAKSDDRKQFSEICEEILKLNADLQKQDKEED